MLDTWSLYILHQVIPQWNTKELWEFPGGPVVRTGRFHCCGPHSIPDWTKTPQAIQCTKGGGEMFQLLHILTHICHFLFLLPWLWVQDGWTAEERERMEKWEEGAWEGSGTGLRALGPGTQGILNSWTWETVRKMLGVPLPVMGVRGDSI